MSNTTIILGTVLVVLIIYMLFQSYFDGEQKLLNQSYLRDANNIIVGNISKPNASNFSYGIWIYVEQWQAPAPNNEVETRIFTRQDELGLYLDNDATLKLRVADTGNKNVKTGISTDYSTIILTNNFPIQKWVHVGLVIDGNKFDGYIDGKMVKSVGLKGTGITPSAPAGTAAYAIEFGKGNKMADSLMVAEHKRLTYPMDPQGIWDLYMEGNGANGLTQAASDLNINLSILKDGVESSSFSLW